MAGENSIICVARTTFWLFSMLTLMWATDAIAVPRREIEADTPEIRTMLSKLETTYCSALEANACSPVLNLSAAIARLAEDEFGRTSLQHASRLHRLGKHLLWHTQQRETSTKLLQQALIKFEATLGAEHPRLIEVLKDLAISDPNDGIDPATGMRLPALTLSPRSKRAFDLNEKLLARLEELLKEYRYLEADELAEDYLDYPVEPDAVIFSHQAVEMRLHAHILLRLGRLKKARELAERVLKSEEQPPIIFENESLADSLALLAEIYQAEGDLTAAEALLRRELASKSALSVSSQARSDRLLGLADVYYRQGRYDKALETADLAEKTLTQFKYEENSTIRVEYLRGNIGLTSGNLTEAERHYAKVEEMLRQKSNISPEAYGMLYREVGYVMEKQGKHGQALAKYEEALTLHNKSAARADRIADLKFRMASAHSKNNDYKASLALLQEAIAGFNARSADESDGLIDALSLQARVLFTAGDTKAALESARKATSMLEKRIAGRSMRRVNSLRTSRQREEDHFGLHLSVLAATDSPELAEEAFRLAQLTQNSSTSLALSRVASRFKAASPVVAGLVRDRQDLTLLQERIDDALEREVARPSLEQRVGAVYRLHKERAEITERLAKVEARIAAADPKLDHATRPSLLSLAEVRNTLIKSGEALVVFEPAAARDSMPRNYHAWVVTEMQSVWQPLDVSMAEVTEAVERLRCGLDAAAWADDGAEKCGLFFGARSNSDSQLPFDADTAHRLYQALFGKIDSFLQRPDGGSRPLVVVASGPLQKLPLHVLLTAPPAAGGSVAKLSALPWLAKRHAVTMLPSIASLKSLRSASLSAAARPMIAFANPVLQGQDPDEGGAAKLGLEIRRKAAIYRQNCDLPASEEETALELAVSFRSTLKLGSTESGAEVRAWEPIPRTASIVCKVAREPGFAGSAIYLGDSASEEKVRELSASGELAQYRIIQFATHGALAGDVSGIAEPGLILTPQVGLGHEHDGYLAASEIMGLKLDADWVILSACNTAAGGERGAESLSGLARAFFYAQARALLVSHWAVYGEAASRLVTTMLIRQSTEGMGGAEALRRAMVALIEKGSGREAHPAFWAPFFVVGAAGR